MRTPLIAGNWKMYKTEADAVDTVRRLAAAVSEVTTVEVMVAPPFTALSAVARETHGTVVRLGAQNLFWESEGAFTGEIAPGMLTALGCTYVIVGHSERRQYFGETDETVNRRIKAALAAGLIPVFCVGETAAQRDGGETFSVLDKQVEIGLQGVSLKKPGDLVVAYEPVWAIGTGKTATSQQAQDVHRHLRDQLAQRLAPKTAEGIRILYGGSVKPGNVTELMAMPDIDGALVGGASLDADTFSQIVRF
ncbi:MAG: triose-phosphate isomerase [Pseudomonadota bacterium]